MTEINRSLNDITGLARQIASAICEHLGLSPDERDGYGKYRWEAFLDEAREYIHLVRLWDENQHLAEQNNEQFDMMPGKEQNAYMSQANDVINAMGAEPATGNGKQREDALGSSAPSNAISTEHVQLDSKLNLSIGYSEQQDEAICHICKEPNDKPGNPICSGAHPREMLDNRARFEEWASRSNYASNFARFPDGTYEDDATSYLWTAWQAALREMVPAQMYATLLTAYTKLKSQPEPVSVDAIAGLIEIAPPYSPTDEYYATFIKAVLEAAGVPYVE